MVLANSNHRKRKKKIVLTFSTKRFPGYKVPLCLQVVDHTGSLSFSYTKYVDCFREVFLRVSIQLLFQIIVTHQKKKYSKSSSPTKKTKNGIPSPKGIHVHNQRSAFPLSGKKKPTEQMQEFKVDAHAAKSILELLTSQSRLSQCFGFFGLDYAK